MPATSNAQRAAMAIAKNNPGKLYKRNRGMLDMTSGQLDDFVSSPVTKRPTLSGSPGAMSRRALLRGMRMK